MSSTKVITAPTFEPVTRDDVKMHLRIDGDDDDWFLDRSITSARVVLEQYLRMALPQQTLQSIIELELPPHGQLSGWLDYTSGKIEIPFPPLISITNVGVEVLPGNFTSILDPTTYYTDLASVPGSIWVQATAFSTLVLPVWTVWSEPFWPRFQITYTCGYANPAAIPQSYKDMLLEMIGNKYQNREGPHLTAGLEEEIRNQR